MSRFQKAKILKSSIPFLPVGKIVMVRYHRQLEPVKVLNRSKRSNKKANQYLVKRKGRGYMCCQNKVTQEWELYRD